MKKREIIYFIILTLLLVVSHSAYTDTRFAAIDGYCYLEGEESHEGTKILFNAVSSSANTDSTYTNADGSFLMGLSEGIYYVQYSHEGCQPYVIPGEINFFEDTTLDDVTLSEEFLGQVSGPQSGIWTSYHTYQVIGDISVSNGDTLIIEPGVTVRFMDYYSFTINGKLVAAGTESDSIRFTSGQPTANPGNWNNIRFESNSDDNSIISYAIIEYAHNGIYCSSSSPTINNNTISNNNLKGIYCYWSSPTISNNTISNNNDDGIYSTFSSSPIISNNTISNNDYGISINSFSYPTISNNTINNNNYGIYCSYSQTILNNIFYNNDVGVNASSSTSSLEHNLFWLNNDAVYGSYIPAAFGEIVAVNANGDSCDTYFKMTIRMSP